MHRRLIYRLCVFSILGTLIFISKMVMEFLPNIHLIALLITVFTLCYRSWALAPIYVFVFLTGLVNGFSLWWIPYLYIWLPLWAVVMLLPRNMPKKLSVPIYMITGALHGFLYGTLYVPFQALALGLNFEGAISWIIAGLPWDLAHGIGNLLACSLVIPLYLPLKKVSAKIL